VSVHGANRLGSNSLIDLVVFGRAVGLRVGETVQTGARQPEITDAMTASHLARLDKFRNAKGGTPTSQLRLKMQRVMQDHCAVYRTGDTLDEGCQLMDDIHSGSPDIAITDRSMIWNSDLAEAMEYDNLLSQAMVTMYGAANRTESRGAHAREDFADRDDVEWMKHTLAWYDEATGKVKIDYRPVHMNTMSNDVATIPPKARVY
jgi:succinate dehydrogenase / fumarate reductase, flavoprotein subunit